MTVEEFKKTLIDAYEFEVKMSWHFSTHFHDKGDMEMADMWVAHRNCLEGLITQLKIPHYYGD